MKTLPALLTLFLAMVPPWATALDFEPFPQFPAPGPGAYTVVGTPLPDGRLVVWNGDTVFLQHAPNAAQFHPIAQGYAGDPAFILHEPSRGSVLLGAGFSGDIYRLDLANPVDYTPAALVVNTPHYAAVLLSDSLLLVDAGKPGFAGSELSVVDLSGAKHTAAVTIVVRPEPAGKGLVVDKPPFTYSAPLALDPVNGIVYAMSTFGVPQELRYFTLGSLLNAHATLTPLDWTLDGVLIGAAGQFNQGGVAGIQQDGLLILPGFGRLQLVDPSLGNPTLATVMDAFDPMDLGDYYAVIYNAVTEVMLVVDGSGNVYVPVGALVSLPVLGVSGLILLGGALAAMGCRRTLH